MILRAVFSPVMTLVAEMIFWEPAMLALVAPFWNRQRHQLHPPGCQQSRCEASPCARIDSDRVAPHLMSWDGSFLRAECAVAPRLLVTTWDAATGINPAAGRMNRLGLRASGSYGTNDIGYNFLDHDRFCNSSYSALRSDSVFARRSMKLHDLIVRVYLACETSLEREEGQDLVEYALVVALISLGSVTSMKVLSLAIGTAFKDVSSSLLKNI